MSSERRKYNNWYLKALTIYEITANGQKTCVT